MRDVIKLDAKKADPYNLDENTWFYVSTSGRTIDFYHQLKDKQVAKIKLPLKVLDKLRKE